MLGKVKMPDHQCHQDEKEKREGEERGRGLPFFSLNLLLQRQSNLAETVGQGVIRRISS